VVPGKSQTDRITGPVILSPQISPSISQETLDLTSVEDPVFAAV